MVTIRRWNRRLRPVCMKASCIQTLAKKMLRLQGAKL